MATLATAAPVRRETEWSLAAAGVVLVIFVVTAPFVLYPVFIMKALCFALFACAFNLLIG
jgi:branched-chain amino acid transport system permease protein